MKRFIVIPIEWFAIYGMVMGIALTVAIERSSCNKPISVELQIGATQKADYTKYNIEALSEVRI